MLAAMTAGAAAVIALAQLPPTRDLLLKLKDPGEGPLRGPAREVAVHRPLRGAGERHADCAPRSSGGDPGYGETSKMLAESALCLAHDDLPQLSGQLTPAVAMGEKLIERLRSAGIEFKTLETR